MRLQVGDPFAAMRRAGCRIHVRPRAEVSTWVRPKRGVYRWTALKNLRDEEHCPAMKT